MKSTSKKRTPTILNLTVKRRYLTEREVERLMDCARKHGRYGHRDATMILVAYRHGLRASEVCDLQWQQPARRGDKSCDHPPAGLFLVRSLGPTALSASSISRLGLCLDLGNGAGSSAASDDCPLGAGSAAGSAMPSITFAASPARAASMAWMASMACSICSSVIDLTPPECSTRMSLGTKSTSNFKKTAGCCFITLSIALRPPRRKARCISRMVSALRA